MMRCCACCRMPAKPATLHHGEIHDIGVLFGLCARCDQAHRRLPHGVFIKRLNACADLAAGDTSGRYWTARFPNSGAARLAAAMIGNPETAADMLETLGWK